MEAFTTLTAPVLVLEQQNIDTDQIIPARFLTTTGSTGLGAHAFADWRFTADGAERPGCVLNEARAKSSPILVAGRNFGCGSSREHAPWALLDFGFRVVISCEIADIFRNNCQNVGLLPVVISPELHAVLLALDGQQITVDLEACELRLPGGVTYSFDMDAFARYCLLKGMDRLDFLVAEQAAIAQYEVNHEG